MPAIRNILGGFLFSGDDVYKKAGVLSGGERTRLAVARMLLRPSNTLLLDEPTNHLDIDSKEVLLDALADYGGTLVFVSHDRYFVERLATKICRGRRRPAACTRHLPRVPVEQGAGGESGPCPGCRGAGADRQGLTARAAEAPAPAAGSAQDYETRKRDAAERKKREQAFKVLCDRITELEARIADREGVVKGLKAAMAAPGFYDKPGEAKKALNEHEALMWEVGDLLNRWKCCRLRLKR